MGLEKKPMIGGVGILYSRKIFQPDRTSLCLHLLFGPLKHGYVRCQRLNLSLLPDDFGLQTLDLGFYITDLRIDFPDLCVSLRLQRLHAVVRRGVVDGTRDVVSFVVFSVRHGVVVYNLVRFFLRIPAFGLVTNRRPAYGPGRLFVIHATIPPVRFRFVEQKRKVLPKRIRVTPFFGGNMGQLV